MHICKIEDTYESEYEYMFTCEHTHTRTHTHTLTSILVTKCKYTDRYNCLLQSAITLLRFSSVGRMKYTAGASGTASRSDNNVICNVTPLLRKPPTFKSGEMISRQSTYTERETDR